MTDIFDYVESRDDADALIQEFGSAAKLRETTNSGSEIEPVQTTVDTDTYAVRVNFTWQQMQGGNVLETDERWLVAAGPLTAAGVVVGPPDKLVIGGMTRPILRADPLAPAGVVVMYDCHIRF